MNKLFPVYEIGSLPKLNPRIIAFKSDKDIPLEKKHINYVKQWAVKTGIDSSKIVEIFEKKIKEGRALSKEEKEKIVDFNSLLNLRLQEKSGLDFVYDGEARRNEMYRNVVKLIKGVEYFPEMIRSRRADSWRKADFVDKPRLNVPLDELPIIKEVSFVKANTKLPVKVPIDDPYMIANMSGNPYYKEKLGNKFKDNPRKQNYEAKRELTLALAEYIIRPQVEAAIKAGADWIQLDAPSATTDIEHIPIFVEGINKVVEGIEGVKFSIHVCYPKRISLIEKSGYELLFPYILDLDSKINHFSLELANGDQYEKDLKPFAECKRKFEIGVGIVDITHERQEKNIIETPEIVRYRIIKAVDILKDPELVYVAPDCGLRQLSLERAVRLYEIIARGAELARKG